LGLNPDSFDRARAESPNVVRFGKIEASAAKLCNFLKKLKFFENFEKIEIFENFEKIEIFAKLNFVKNFENCKFLKNLKIKNFCKMGTFRKI